MIKRRNSIKITALFMIVGLACFFSFLVSGEEDTRHDLSFARDPFVPLVGVSNVNVKRGIEGIFTIMDAKFQGTTTGTDGKKAIVLNGELIEEGESVGLVMVEKVGANTATISIDGVSHNLSLYKNSRR